MSARSVSWIASLGIAVLVGLAALFAGGLVAALCVDWYRISSHEGNSGFFVLFMALFSGIGGALLGLIVARAAAAVPTMNGLKALGLGLGVVLGVAGGVAGGARLLADVPPTIDGEVLHLIVELRWPAGQRPPSPSEGVATVRLGTLAGRTLRREEVGPLFLEDARLEGNRWIVPGVVDIFTSRGTPVVNAFVGSRQLTSLLPPLRGYPRRADLEWSQWREATPEGQAPIGVPVSYRFRVSRLSEPVRWQSVGPLTIGTRVDSFFNTSGTEALSAFGSFAIRHDGREVPGIEDARDLSVVSTTPLALLARSDYTCYLVTLTPAGPVVAKQPPCNDKGPMWKVQSSTTVKAVDVRAMPRGWLDRDTFREPGLYLLGPAMLDTRTLTITTRGWPDEPYHQLDMPPLGLSPDEKTMAWFSPGNGYDKPPVIATLRLDSGATATLPLDRPRMRYRTPQLDIDGAWLMHHFSWRRGDDGVDQLEARTDFTPLPHRGALSEPKPGDYQSYAIAPGGPALQAAVVELLIKELHGTRMEEEYASANTPRVAIDDEPISVQFLEGGGIDGGGIVSVHSYKSRPEIMARIAAHIDAVLASGRFDALLIETTP